MSPKHQYQLPLFLARNSPALVLTAAGHLSISLPLHTRSHADHLISVQNLANMDMSELTEAGRAAKEALGELTIKRINRYQDVRMPDYQSLFFGGR